MLKLLYHLCFIGVAAYIVFATVQFRNNYLEAQNGLTASRNQYLELQKALRNKPQKLLFVGDIMLARLVGKMIAAKNDPFWPFREIADTLRAADFAFGNLENPISSRGKNQGSIYSFRAAPNTVDGLVFSGFDAVSLANNHMWDYGREALADTLETLKSKNIRPVGAGLNYEEANAPVRITLGDNQVSLFAYTNLYPPSLEAGAFHSGISDWNVEKILEDIRAEQEKSDVVVVSLHWGEEYESQSNEYQRSLARALADAGADLIIGHHPHVVQEVEKYMKPLVAGAHSGQSTAWIAYSLGNFVFDQTFSEATMRGLMLEAIVQEKKIKSIKEVPIQISREFQPVILGNTNSEF